MVSFRQTLRSEAGEEIRVATDFEYSYPRIDREIVIGKTTLEGKYYTLPETSKNLEKGAYAIDVIDSRVILSYGAVTAEALAAATALRARGKRIGVLLLEMLKPYETRVYLWK